MGIEIQASRYDHIKAKDIFKKNGFIIVRKLLDYRLIEDCNHTLKAGMDKVVGDHTIDLCGSLMRAFNTSETSYRSYLRTFAKSLKVQSLFLQNEVQLIINDLGVIEPSTPTTPVTHVMSENLVCNGIEKVATVSHQDWPSIQGSIDSVVVWIPLTSITSDSYPIQVIPGSHSDGLRECKISEKVSVIDLTPEDEARYIDVICEPGDVVIFSTFLIHRTKITSDTLRIAVSNRFDNMLEKSFIERSFPCAYVRIVDRQIVNPPDNERIKTTLNEI